MESYNIRLENMENMEKMENIKQKNKNTMFMTQNTLFMTQNTLIVNQMTQNTLFTAFIASVEKSKHARLENMILGQLKIGEHQVTCRALHHSRMYHLICGGISGICVACRILV